MAGLTATGFRALRLDEVRAELEALWRGTFGANADLSADSPDAQIVGILAEREASLWELLAAVYAAVGLDSATGAALDELAALAAVTRLPATASTVTLTLTGTPGTVLAAGRRVSLDDSGTVWTLPAATIGGGGTVDVLATASATGPTPALAGSDWTIDTPVTGWTSVANALDADEGRSVETDEALRQRVRRGFSAAGAPSDGLRAAISRLANVTEVIVVANTGYVTDADGRPPKSVEAIVRGGADDEIAQALWATKAMGIEAYSASADSGTATTALGTTVAVPLTRPTVVDVWITVALTVDASRYPPNGDDLVEAEALGYEDVLTVGADVVPFEVLQRIETPGILAAEVRVGRAANPTLTTPLGIGLRELAALDSSRITVTRI